MSLDLSESIQHKINFFKLFFNAKLQITQYHIFLHELFEVYQQEILYTKFLFITISIAITNYISQGYLRRF